ncbi:MAG TPA: hypothetical protein VF211_08880 [Burkholderiales bacterium]
MHCELVVPGLFAGEAGAPLPAIELLLARARGSSAERCTLRGWLHETFGLGEAPHPAGALTVLGAGGDPGDACWTRADPAHLRVMRDRLVLVPGHALAIRDDEAAALCEALDRHFAPHSRFRRIDAVRWCAQLAEDASYETDCPLDIAGRDVDLARPAQRGAAHRLLNEAQMLLHDHPVNAAREARGEPAINSIWLWGAGRRPREVSARWQSVSADEPLALGLGRAGGARTLALPASARDWLEQAPPQGRHLVVLDALRAPLALGEAAEHREALARLERDWFAPLLAALRAGRIGMLSVHVPDGPDCMCYEAIRGDLRRFWRRPRRLQAYG